jgi:hypothetical protein
MLALLATLPVALSSAGAAPPTPPPLAPSFSVRFRETFTGFPAPPSTGAWYYSFPDRHWRVEHDAPNSNNFCSCALNTSDSCALLFTPAGMYVDFRDHPHQCCRLCGAAEGCTVLSPTWLANGTLQSQPVNGCREYCEPGDEATADCMSFPPSNTNPPCAYMETFAFGGTTVTHNLTFEPQTYAEGPQDAALFAVRSECQQPCPNLFPATCG